NCDRRQRLGRDRRAQTRASRTARKLGAPFPRDQFAGIRLAHGCQPRGAAGFSSERLERAIGVIYLPETERVSHYFEARFAQPFDAMIHVDETRAVEPLERTSQWEAGELPETYPSAV